MYYLKKFCCVCMGEERMLINTKYLSKNVMYFYYKYVIRDVNNASVKIPLYFCMRCFKMLKDYYNFSNQCIRSKRALEKYFVELNNVNVSNDNLGDFNISVYLTDIDPYKQIKGTVITSKDAEEVLELNQKSPDDETTEEPEENGFMNDYYETNYDEDDEEVESLLKPEVNEIVDEPKTEECDGIDDMIREGKINQVKILKVDPKPILKRPKFRYFDPTIPKPAPRRYRCKICGNEYRGAKYLQIHMMIHTGERPFSCDMCSKTFRQLPHLTQHKMIHFDLRPHQCHICNKSFRQVAHLRSHMMCHTNERNYKCGVCGKTFRSSANLNSHRKVHTKMRKIVTVQNGIQY